MGRGLGPLQRSILEALEAYPRGDWPGDTPRLARQADLLRDLGRARTSAARSTISDALASLVRRGLVEVWHGPASSPWTGARYCLPGRYHPE